MDPTLVQAILGGLLGSGGLSGLVVLVRTLRRRKDGLPEDEAEARRTADWEALNAYFQSELKTLRDEKKKDVSDLRKEVQALRTNQEALRNHMQAQAEADATHIDTLEQHIWLRLPPPPPTRVRPSAPPPIPGT